MRINEHQKSRLSHAPMFEEKRVEFWSWLSQITIKLAVNMSDKPLSVQFWYIHSRLKKMALSQITPWVAAHIKSDEVLICMIMNELINQLQHAYNNLKS